MKSKPLLWLITAVAILSAGCNALNPSPGAAAAKQEPATPKGNAGASSCPVTRPPDSPFIPPEPWPPEPPGEDQFWFGHDELWTALPEDGSWRQLALGEKFWWWSEDFDVSEDDSPDVQVTAERLDGKAPDFRATEATNGFHPSFNWAMLVGVELPSPGCWQFTGEYKGQPLSFILWVPAE